MKVVENRMVEFNGRQYFVNKVNGQIYINCHPAEHWPKDLQQAAARKLSE